MTNTPRTRSFDFQGPTSSVFPDQVFFTLNGVRINCVEEIDGLTILQFAEVAGSATSAN